MLKQCSKCGKSKPTSEFGKDSQKRDGLTSSCFLCRRISNATYRANNLEKEKNRVAKWCIENSGRRLALSIVYRTKNKDKEKALKEKWRAENPSAHRIYAHNRRARIRANGGALSSNLALKLITLQRSMCACGCMKPVGNKYHLDHIMPLALGGTNTDDNIQLLRPECNQQKHAKHPVEFMRLRGFLI